MAKKIKERYKQAMPMDSVVYVTICGNCNEQVFGWTELQANMAWNNHKCKTEQNEKTPKNI